MSCATAFPIAGHDHNGCLQALLARAERRCAMGKARLTAQRRRVLEIVASGHTAVGAYDILARMRNDGRLPAPAAVYRALDFLLRQGLIHRVESRNAYVACLSDEEEHRAQFLVCEGCGRVAELNSPAIERAISSGAAAAAFTITTPVVEISGRCHACQTAARPAGAQ